MIFVADIGTAAAGDTGYYFGAAYTYKRADNYASILGGHVTQLQPAGFGYFGKSWIRPAILVESEISPETAGTVGRLLKGNPRIATLYLNSPGGDLFAGMAFGNFPTAL